VYLEQYLVELLMVVHINKTQFTLSAVLWQEKNWRKIWCFLP